MDGRHSSVDPSTPTIQRPVPGLNPKRNIYAFFDLDLNCVINFQNFGVQKIHA